MGSQNCTLKCCESFTNEIENDYSSCMFNNDCIVLPPINVTCPTAQLTKSVMTNSSLHDLHGEWWLHYGYNALWDCYPCHHIHSMYIINDTTWAYTFSYEVYLVNGSLEYYEETLMLPYSDEVGVPINFTYDYLGSPHEESWYILSSSVDRYVVLGACSFISTWTNVASIVWVRPNVTLTQMELDDISDLYGVNLGWEFPKQFCEPQHGESCPTK